MNEIGELLRSTRINSGISLEEASGDLEIKTLILENIEDGNIGCFKDIFVLKDYIFNYAKYLGLEPNKIIDEFNDYLFEYTSKIPLKDIEKALEEKQKNDSSKEKVVSPYTVSTNKEKSSILFIVLVIIISLLIIIVGIWSIKQIAFNNKATNIASYNVSR